MHRVAIAAIMVLAPAAAYAQVCRGETFADNFSNLNRWSIGGGGSLGSGNGGESSYQGSTPGQNITAGSSGLTMSVLQGAANPSGALYTGAIMSTQNTFSQTYGYFEATMTIPPSMLSSGMTSAFWLLGYQWPPEIDVEESQASAMSSGVHSTTQGETGTYYNYNFSPGQHTFAVNWTPQSITFYEDGHQTSQVSTPANFNQPMYMVLDAMAGPQGGYLGNPNGSSSVTVQQVRAFDNMADAQACGSQITEAGAAPDEAAQDASSATAASPPSCTSLAATNLPSSIMLAKPPSPATAEGMNAFSASAGIKQSAQSSLSQQQAILCELQANLGRLMAYQSANQTNNQ